MKEVKNIQSISTDEQTIKTLESLLEQARSGSLKSLIFIDKHKDGKVGHGWAGQPDKRMIGEMEDVKFNIFSMMYFQTE